MNQRNSGEPFTVGELKAAIADMPDYAWVCVEATPGGPLRAILPELGAGEPFILLETGEPKT